MPNNHSRIPTTEPETEHVVQVEARDTSWAIQILLGILATIAIGIASFALIWVFNANAKIDVMQNTLTLKFEELDKSLVAKFTEFEKTHEGLADDTEKMTRINSQLSKHWRLHTWTKDQVAALRHKNQMEPVSWPNLE